MGIKYSFRENQPTDVNLGRFVESSEVDISAHLGEIRLDNPVIPASGCFGFGYEMNEFYDINILGSISLKGTTLHPRYGNELPRVAECSMGMLNSVGLQNPGVEKVISEELPKARAVYRKPMIANVSGFSVDEYVQTAQRLSVQPGIGIIELNISCPNVHGGGMSFGTDARQAAEVTAAVKSAIGTTPLYVKLTPNVTDIVAIAKSVEEAGADGLCLINTLLGMRIDLKTRKPILANVMGGFSGPAVFPVALRMVYQVSHACRIPVIGCGGVGKAEDVIEMMMAGASAVEVGAANLVNPYACRDIIETLPAVMKKYGLNNLQNI
ncbi:MAG: dihydroorotate dehydrogenase [Muribaculum sp.]|nr:dihydroorotate dehydrogenase [Muribaculum sp.]